MNSGTKVELISGTNSYIDKMIANLVPEKYELVIKKSYDLRTDPFNKEEIFLIKVSEKISKMNIISAIIKRADTETIALVANDFVELLEDISSKQK